MKKLKRTGLAALLLATILGGYGICMQNVQAAGEDIDLETEEFSDEQQVNGENQAPEEVSTDLSDEQDENDLIIEEDPEDSSFTDDKNAQTAEGEEDNKDFMETEKSGFCGTEEKSVSWKLEEDGTLRIAGQGNMISWEKETDVPWAQYRTDIKKIEIEEDVTSIGAYAFYECKNVMKTVLPDSIQEIGEFAFFNCSGLSTVTIG